MENPRNHLHSIVVPVYQAETFLGALVENVEAALKKADIKKYELILVDDGSADYSFEKIKHLAEINPHILGLQLSRNFGHQAALITGLKESTGEFIGIIDDDLQDPPEVLTKLFETLHGGADIAYGIRRGRKENFITRFFYSTFYKVLSVLSRVEIPCDVGDFSAMRRNAVDALLKLNDARPFLRGQRAWIGFKGVGIEYERAASAGKSSRYNFKKYIRFALSGIFSFSYVPLRLTTYLGLIVAAFCVIFSLKIFIMKIFNTFDVPGYASIVMLITFLGSAQLISVGILGEYIARLYDETRRWPIAIVASKTRRK